ncbi:MAG: GrpB family protein [Saprospiraceae bacterium]|jgi:GrpB-like predicted nucleotidyltransferase (UPF0157 family)|nr:GrpB family protein [Saprospiraceae bacterium]
MLINDYTSDRIRDFEKIKIVLESSLNGVESNIEHVSGTSVPKLGAKPIIYIDISYQSVSEFEKIKSCLTKIGYFHNGSKY